MGANMPPSDYALLAACIVGFTALLTFSKRARIIVCQSLFNPNGNGYLVIPEAGLPGYISKGIDDDPASSVGLKRQRKNVGQRAP